MTAAVRPVTLVTGAASGIGRATVELLLEQGGAVAAFDRDSGALGWLAGHGRARAVIGDVTSEADNVRAVAAVQETFGRLDGLVLNAGAPASGPIEELDLATFDACVDVNLRAVVLGLRAALPALRASRGSVVVTASVTALGGEPNRWPYAAAKAGAVNLMRSVALDVAADGVRVNAVCPGPVSTGMTRRIEEGDSARYDTLRSVVPLQRWAAAGEVAAVVAFLLSDDAAYVCGEVVSVDGGATATNTLRPSGGAGRWDPSLIDP